jgi:hypothetical protein
MVTIMEEDATRALDLMRKMRALHTGGSRDDAMSLYRSLATTWRQLDQQNIWAGDEVRTTEAVDVILWMNQTADLPPFSRGWPDWLAQWFAVLHGPTAKLPRLKFKKVE